MLYEIKQAVENVAIHIRNGVLLTSAFIAGCIAVLVIVVVNVLIEAMPFLLTAGAVLVVLQYLGVI